MHKGIKSVVTTTYRQRPVVFGDTAPEGPDPGNSEEGEESFEQSSIDLAACGLAQVGADHIIEDLTNCKQQASTGEIYCCSVSEFFFSSRV